MPKSRDRKSWYAMRAQDDGRVGEIEIYEEIGFWGIGAAEFIRDLKAMGALERLVVRINSPGGDVFQGVAIYNALRRQSAQVEVRVDGLAASAASFIAMAGDPVIMPENTMMMIHDPSGVAIGPASTMREMADALEKVTDAIVSMYQAKAVELDAEEIAEMMAATSWLTAAEAVDKGLADEMVPATEISARFDRGRFQCGEIPAEAARFFQRETVMVNVKPSTLADRQLKNLRAALAASPGESFENAAPRKGEGAVMDLKNLSIEELKAERPDLVAALEPKNEINPEAERRAGAEAERARIAGIDEHALPGHDELVAQAKKDGTSVEDFAKMMVAAEKQRGARLLENRKKDESANAEIGRVPAGQVSIGASREDPENRREIVATALAARYLGTQPEGAARDFVGMTAVDLAREFLPNGGRGLSPTRIIENALTTSDFPHTLGAGADKILLQRYEEYPATYMAVSNPMTLNDFKQKKLIRFGDFPKLIEVKEDGEYNYGPIGEAPEFIQLKTYGRLVSLSRQALVNDDLGAFMDMAAMIGEAVRRFENALVWSVITTNGAMGDGKALFHADHGNLAGTGGAPSSDTIGDGKKAMRKQVSVDGEKINLQPAVIASPTDLETTIEKLLSELIIPQTPDQLTPASQRALNRVVEPLLDDDSTTAWYLFAANNRRAGLVYANLTGVNGPETFMDEHFTRDGMTWKVRRDFAAAAEDYRGLYKNPGA